MKAVVLLQPFGAANILADVCKALGHKLVILASDHGLRKVPEGVRSKADIFKVIDTNDYHQVLETIRGLMAHGEAIHAVVPGFETYVDMANKINQVLGLKGLPVDCAEKVRYKDKMRLALQQGGIATPRFAILNREQDLLQAMERIGFPAVLKATNLGGSFNVRKVQDRDEALSIYRQMITLDVEVLDLKSSPRILYEEYMAGPEFSIEGYINEKTFNMVSITEKHLGPEPYFVELGHIVEADLDAGTYNQIDVYIRQVVKCLNITLGVIHGEVRVTKEGVKLVEIAARLAGDNICDLVKIAKGVDLAEIMIKAYLGEPVANYVVKKGKHAGIIFFHLENDGTFYSEAQGIDQLQRLPGFEKYAVIKQPNVKLKPLIDSASRVACAVFSGPDYQSVRSAIAEAKRLVKFL